MGSAASIFSAVITTQVSGPMARTCSIQAVGSQIRPPGVDRCVFNSGPKLNLPHAPKLLSLTNLRPNWALSCTVHPFLVAVARSCVRFTRIATLITKFGALACRYPPTARKACLLDRIRDPPIAQELKRNADPLINALNWQGVPFARSTQRRRSPPELPDSQTAIAAHWIAATDQPPHLYLELRFRGPV
jgi:hypothetical protein